MEGVTGFIGSTKLVELIPNKADSISTLLLLNELPYIKLGGALPP